jgi:hypothetical protein
MKILRLISGVFIAALACATIASAAQAPPPIDMAALQAYAPGTGVISGYSYFPAMAFCAPDIPYVTWYVGKLNDDNPPAYDQRMQPYTRTAEYAAHGFECTGLSPGRYIVWLENPRARMNYPAAVTVGALQPIGVLGPQTNIPNHVTGEDGPAQYQAAYPGSDIPLGQRDKYRRMPIPPAHVLLGNGTVKVNF